MPHLQDLWSEISQKRNDVAILCVNIGDDAEVINQYWKDNEFTLTAVQQSGGEVSEAFGVMAYPTNYVIGKDGKVVWRGVGYDAASIRKFLGAESFTP